MKQFKNLVALVLVAVMSLALVGSAMAQTEAYTGSDGDGAKITVSNAAKGCTYSVVKLFDATVTGTEGGSIAYQGTIPSTMDAIFSKNDTTGEITYIGNGTSGQLTTDESDILKTWASSQDALKSAVSDGSKLEFTNLPYGYYVVLTTQGAGAVTVTNTNPNATVNDKNTTTITAKKEVDKQSYSIGDTITYTATFDTTNYYAISGVSKVVTQYDIEDTLPNFLSNVSVTSITIGGDDYKTGTPAATPQFDANKKIIIPWATKDANTGEWTSLYANGAKIIVTYTAVLTDVTNINTADTNTVKIQPHVGDNDEKPWEDEWEKSTQIKTYGVAIHKVDETGADLKGATFTVKGLTVKDGDAAGEYIVVSYSDAANASESAELATNDDGYLYIVGLASDVKLTFTEYTAPNGYNKLAAPVTNVAPQLMSTAIYTSSTKILYDSKGNVIEFNSTSSTAVDVTKNLADLDAEAVEIQNLKGTELPSTGGIGTTIIYVVGAVLVLGAAAVILARRKAEQQ